MEDFAQDDLGNTYTGVVSNRIGSTVRNNPENSLINSTNCTDVDVQNVRDTNFTSPKDVNANKADPTTVRGGLDTSTRTAIGPVQTVVSCTSFF